MTKYCCVQECRNTTRKGTAHHFHKFPKDEVFRKEWIRRLQINWQPSPHEIVCSDHFRSCDYSLSNYGGKIVLKRGSLPISLTTDTLNNGEIESSNSLKTNDVKNPPTTETLNTTEVISASVSLTTDTLNNDEIEPSNSLKTNEVKSPPTTETLNTTEVISASVSLTTDTLNNDEIEPSNSLKTNEVKSPPTTETLNTTEVISASVSLTTDTLNNDEIEPSNSLKTNEVKSPPTTETLNTTEVISASVSLTTDTLNNDEIEPSNSLKTNEVKSPPTTETLNTTEVISAATIDLNSQNDHLILQGQSDSVNGECVTEDLKSSDSRTKIKTVDAAVMVKPEVEDKGVQSSLPGKRTSCNSLTDDNILYFTGMERERFEILYSMVDKFAPIEDSLLWCKKDALIITLHKIRHNEDFKMMEWIFELDRKIISEIFKEVIHKVYVVLKQIDIWNMSLKDVKKYRSIIDCTEFYVVKAGDPNVHQLTYSYYKGHPTFKLLVSCDELGAVNFISDAFVGSISDREIVIKSGLLDKLEKGDAVLADRGFDVSDLLEPKGVALNIPPFLKGKEQLSEYDVIKTRIIANRRILIENVNCRAKKNKVLVTPLQKSLWPYANKIIYVCFALVNFYKPLKEEHPF